MEMKTRGAAWAELVPNNLCIRRCGNTSHESQVMTSSLVYRCSEVTEPWRLSTVHVLIDACIKAGVVSYGDIIHDVQRLAGKLVFIYNLYKRYRPGFFCLLLSSNSYSSV